MKKISIICLTMLSVAFLSCKDNASSKIKEGNISSAKERDSIINLGSPIIEFSTKEYDFGTVVEGEKVEGTFIVTNKGKTDLLITQVKPSCGCTTPDWTKEAIAPGKSGEIKFLFNSKGRVGKQNKSITVKSNAEKLNEVIRIKGTVTAKS